ncbi:MAG: extracellular solute-binding protein, partial [Bacilli bacterium]
FFEQDPYADFGVAMDAVSTGKAAMMISGSWVVGQIQDRLPEGKDRSIIKMAPYPDLSGNGRFVVIGDSLSHAVNKNSDNKEMAKKWIEYLNADTEILEAEKANPNRLDIVGIPVPDNAIIDSMVSDSIVVPIIKKRTYADAIIAAEILKDMNLLSDFKYYGDFYDALNTDQAKFDKLIQQYNDIWKKELEK